MSVCAVLVFIVVLQIAYGVPRFGSGETDWAIRYSLVSIAFGVAGLVVAGNRPRGGLWVVLLVGATAFALASLDRSLYGLGVMTGSEVPGGRRLIVEGLATVGFSASIIMLPLWIPAGHTSPRRLRVLVGTAISVGLAYLAVAVWQAWNVTDPDYTFDALARDHPLWSALQAPVTLILPLIVLSAVCGDTVRRAKAGRGLTRRQLVLIIAAELGYWTIVSLYTVVRLIGPWDKQWEDVLLLGPQTVVILLFPMVAIAQTGSRRARLALQAWLCAAVLVAGLYATFKAVLLVVAAVLPWSATVRIAAAATVATLVTRRIAASVWQVMGWMLYGGKSLPYRTIRSLGRSLREHRGDDDVAADACGLIVDRLDVERAKLIVHTGDGERTVAERGASGGTAHRFELRHNGTDIGELVVHAERLSRRDHVLLASMADQLAPMVAAMRLREVLRASRERVVLAREAERYRLRRDLHDGLGPALVGMRLRLEAAAVALPAGTPIGTHIADTIDDLDTALVEVRRITAGLRPADLDELGLPRALQRLAASMPNTRFHAPERIPAQPPAIEVAAYRIVAEALTNAARHAAASAVEVTITAEAGVLTVTVADDGHGFVPSKPHLGLGLSSMVERAEEVGGSCCIDESSYGGVRVSARLPYQPLPTDSVY
ncbi:hypothetical protein GCM10027167_22320 [Nocardia heshunensis]